MTVSFKNLVRTSPSVAVLLCGLFSTAATITGTVRNKTISKPSANDDVILIKLAQGMEEAGRTKTDASGKFSLDFDGDDQPHLIRVVHQGVTYHQPAPPGTTSVAVDVYDVSKKVEGVKAVADLMYVQAQKGQLGVSRIFAVSNNAKPPRTQMNDRNFEFYLPEGAHIDSAQAQTAGGQWVNSSAIPEDDRGKYAFSFPLRPGQTELQVSYHLPYDGKIRLDPKIIYPLDHFVVIMPESIHFSPTQRGLYEDKKPPSPPGAIAEVASHTHPGQSLSFEISGEGILEEGNAANANDGQPDTSNGAQSASDTRPGGGLGPPIDAPDPLQKYRWYLLGGLAVLLLVGAMIVWARSRKTPSPNFAPEPENANPKTETVSPVRSEKLLEALKEELFQLEVEHKQGHISQEEYNKVKSALDQTLERALKRTSSA